MSKGRRGWRYAPQGRTCVSRTEGTALGTRASLQDRKCHQATRPRVGTLTGTLEATASAPRWAQKWAFSSESVPVAQPPTAAGQLYGEEDENQGPTQVRLGPQSIVNGTVQPEAAVAVNARTSPRTTLYFKRDMTTPVHERRMFRPRGVILRECNAECYGIHQICGRPRVKRLDRGGAPAESSPAVEWNAPGRDSIRRRRNGFAFISARFSAWTTFEKGKQCAIRAALKARQMNSERTQRKEDAYSRSGNCRLVVSVGMSRVPRNHAGARVQAYPHDHL